jgi:molecular chaperone DnaK (HSP70)
MQVENVMEDKDFKQRITRDDLDSLVGDLYKRVAAPALDALKMAELSPVCVIFN